MPPLELARCLRKADVVVLGDMLLLFPFDAPETMRHHYWRNFRKGDIIDAKVPALTPYAAVLCCCVFQITSCSEL